MYKLPCDIIHKTKLRDLCCGNFEFTATFRWHQKWLSKAYLFLIVWSHMRAPAVVCVSCWEAIWIGKNFNPFSTVFFHFIFTFTEFHLVFFRRFTVFFSSSHIVFFFEQFSRLGVPLGFPTKVRISTNYSKLLFTFTSAREREKQSFSLHCKPVLWRISSKTARIFRWGSRIGSADRYDSLKHTGDEDYLLTGDLRSGDASLGQRSVIDCEVKISKGKLLIILTERLS